MPATLSAERTKELQRDASEYCRPSPRLGVRQLTFNLGALALLHTCMSLLVDRVRAALLLLEHQFEGTWRVRSQLIHDLAPLLRWFTGVPNYRLRAFASRFPELKTMNRLTITSALACIKLALRDEDRRRMVTFRALQSESSDREPRRMQRRESRWEQA